MVSGCGGEVYGLAECSDALSAEAMCIFLANLMPRKKPAWWGSGCIGDEVLAMKLITWVKLC